MKYIFPSFSGLVVLATSGQYDWVDSPEHFYFFSATKESARKYFQDTDSRFGKLSQEIIDNIFNKLENAENEGRVRWGGYTKSDVFERIQWLCKAIEIEQPKPDKFSSFDHAYHVPTIAKFVEQNNAIIVDFEFGPFSLRR